MTIPTNKLMYFCLDYGFAIFCFYSFPMVCFLWLSQTNRQLIVNHFKSRRGRQILRWLDGITDLDGLEFEWTLRVVDGQRGLACCNSWGCRVGYNWATELNWWDWMPWSEFSECWVLSQLFHTFYKKQKTQNKNIPLFKIHWWLPTPE